jgi:uncharacterized membrane-anchored protein
MMQALEELQLPPNQVMDVHITLYGYVQGLAMNLEINATAEAESGMSDEQWVDTQLPVYQQLVQSGRYPSFARILNSLQHGYDFDLDTLFEYGLGALLDGIAARHASAAP